MRRYPTPESLTAIVAAFVPEKFIDASVPPDGSHHAYPAGLAVHECFNATIATHYVRTYDDLSLRRSITMR